MSIKQTRRFLHWLIPISSIGSVCIFVVTFLAYSRAHTEHHAAGYTPGILGILMFFVLMTCLTYLSLPGPRDSLNLFTAIGIALIESAAFGYLLLFLLANTFGS